MSSRGGARERLLSEIVRRRVREMIPLGFTAADIALTVGKTERHVRNIVAQEFPDGPSTFCAAADLPPEARS